MYRGTEAFLIQLPLNPSAPLENTGNIPLAGAVLAAAAGLPVHSVMDQETADLSGDRMLLDIIAEREPEIVAFTLYSWNAERSSYIGKELKNILPDTFVIAGGPEATSDNEWLINEGGFDLLICGEGEPVAGDVLSLTGLRKLTGRSQIVMKVGPADFIPGSWPDPWLNGYLDPSGGASVHVETVRGCSYSCVYCSYRRSHPHPRVMPAGDALDLLSDLARAGAGEIVFLDPTFNSRKDLHSLLSGMSCLDLECFGEMRGELISSATARAIAGAGFRSVEIGLQSSDPLVLQRSGRSGNPRSVLEGALNLSRNGVIPVIDLMLGLPGDSPAGAISTAELIKDLDLHRHIQVFHLSMLPGTDIRQIQPGKFAIRPPYFIDGYPGFVEWENAREEIADIVGFDLEMGPRPLLFDGWPGTESLYLDNVQDRPRTMPSYRHGALRIISVDPWSRKDVLLDRIAERIKADPFCVLDVILQTEQEFPLDLLDLIRELDICRDYSGRVARALVKQGNLRVSIKLRDWRQFSMTWIQEAAQNTCIVAEESHPSLLDGRLWASGVFLLLPGSGWDISELSSSVPSVHQVLFRDRVMEERWCREVLDI